MKKIYLISIILSLCLSNSESEYKGVKKQRCTTYNYKDKFGELNEIIWSIEEIIFNVDGLSIDSSNYESDSSLFSKTITKYNSNNNIIEKSFYDSKGNLTGEFLTGISKYIYTYDSNFNLIEETWFDEEGNLFENEGSGSSKIIYKYNSNNNIIEKSFYDSKGKLINEGWWTDISQTIFKYDIDNNIEEINKNNENKVVSKKINKFDSHNNLLESIESGTDGSVISKEIYNLKNKIIESVDYKSKTTIYLYDSNDNLVEKSFYNSDSTFKLGTITLTEDKDFLGVEKYIYKYDSNNTLIEESWIDSESKSIKKTIYYKYNVKNLIIESSVYDYKEQFGEQKEILFSKKVYEYEYY